MTRAQLRRFKELLEGELDAAALRVAQSRQHLSVDHSADALEETCLNLDRDLAFASLSQDSDVLREIRAALTRIGDGNFGTCVSCGDEIGAKRLNAVPWTPLCIHCQEASDREEADSQELLRGIHANAA
jgi:DnaK suppressor protein